ncbi:hypothetical protein [Chitinophaga caseinilytica]|uniref:YgiT-type zinc finger domain-containing protein n=1 Tax=Chitinophaga caseinilytica TaxID=2267521 RepID=A0ABZ2Z364_9BACT
MDKLCCGLFKEMLGNAGRSGFAALPNICDTGEIHIFLQGRNQDSNLKEGKLTIIQQGIAYCPFCGTKFSETIQANRELMEGLAEKNRNYIL